MPTLDAGLNHYGAHARQAFAGTSAIELCLGADRRAFTVRVADEQSRRVEAHRLVDRMYSRRGYETGFIGKVDSGHRMTFVASDAGEALGTLTLGLDSRDGLLADAMYGEEINAVRAQGRSVCELTKLAVDLDDGSKRVLASLFHTAYIYGRLINRVTDVFIEVNPRHAPFYRRMLGFVQAGPERSCPRVNAPAVLLRLELEHCDSEIARCGGQGGVNPTGRSLYPYFFSKHEEEGIARRLMGLHRDDVTLGQILPQRQHAAPWHAHAAPRHALAS